MYIYSALSEHMSSQRFGKESGILLCLQYIKMLPFTRINI